MVIDLATGAGLSPDQLYFNIERVGNASSASIPLAIHDAVRDGVITAPTRVFAPGFGAGAVAGYAVLRIDPAVIAPDDRPRRRRRSRTRLTSRPTYPPGPTWPSPSDTAFIRLYIADESTNCATSAATMAAGPGICRSCPAGIVTRRASGMRAASQPAVRRRDGRVVVTADHEGGRIDTAENGDAGPGRDGRDLPEHAQRIRSRPPCSAARRQQDAGDIAASARNGPDATRGRQQHESVHARWDGRPRAAGRLRRRGRTRRHRLSRRRPHRGPVPRHPPTSASSTARRGVSLAPTPGPSKVMTVLPSKRVGEVRPALPSGGTCR